MVLTLQLLFCYSYCPTGSENQITICGFKNWKHFFLVWFLPISNTKKPYTSFAKLLPSPFMSGLLTVDPTQRLKVREVVNHEWLRGSTCLPHTPLMTPGILGKGHKRTFVESALNVTYDAFNRAHKEGFTLMDVQQAPLAKRRKKNKTTSTDSRSTTSSDHSNSGGTSPLLNPRWHGNFFLMTEFLKLCTTVIILIINIVDMCNTL